MGSYTYKVYDDFNTLIGTFSTIENAVIFVKAYFNEYHKENFNIKIEQVIE